MRDCDDVKQGAALQSEIAAELKKSEALTAQYIKFTTVQGHSRARTTTYNANAGRIAERVKFLRNALKQATA